MPNISFVKRSSRHLCARRWLRIMSIPASQEVGDLVNAIGDAVEHPPDERRCASDISGESGVGLGFVPIALLLIG